jgi:hypothetical protein
MATPKDPSYRPPPGATLNEYGYWVLPSGDFAPGQDMSGQMAGATPAQQAATGGPVQTDAAGKPYRVIDGKKWYLPPMQGNTGDQGGGLIHGRAQWNPETGQYDTPLDWGKILSMVAAGVITAGVANAALASTPELAATAPAGASASTAVPATAATTAASDGSAFDAAGNFIGPTTVTSAPTAGPGILNTAKQIATVATPVSKILDTASQIGNALTANEAGRANGRIAQSNANAVYDRTATDRFNSEIAANNAKNTYGLNAATGENNFDLSRGNLANSNAATDLAQRNFALAAPGKRASNAVRGDILSRAQDVTVSGLAPGQQAVQFNGGLRPSMFSPSTRALGANMSDQALSEQQAGDHFAPLPGLPNYVAPPAYSDAPAPPALSPMPTPGATDSILNTASTVGNFANLISKLPYGTTKAQTPTTPYDPNDEQWIGG